MKKDERELSVSYLNQPRTNSSDVQVPYLKLSGKWMEDAGFEIGDRVKVLVESNGKIVIKKRN